MDYEKAYKDMVQRARELYESGNALTRQQMGVVCPELKESEDESIRKEIVRFIKESPDMGALTTKRYEQWLAWLEKQKEQKTIQSKNEKEYVRILKSIIADFIRDKKPKDISFYQQIYDWLDGRHIEQQPAEWSEEDIKKIRSEEYTKGFNDAAFGGKLKEWSEEDKKRLESVIHRTEVICGGNAYGEIKDDIDWLKSLRTQPHWKPSEEQMWALMYAANDSMMRYDYNASQLKKEATRIYSENLQSLYNDLKSL